MFPTRLVCLGVQFKHILQTSPFPPPLIGTSRISNFILREKIARQKQDFFFKKKSVIEGGKSNTNWSDSPSLFWLFSKSETYKCHILFYFIFNLPVCLSQKQCQVANLWDIFNQGSDFIWLLVWDHC